jgi:N-methylhydantoinase A
MAGFRVGVDIGGTFTDIAFLGEDGRRFTKKVSSTVEDYAQAIIEGLFEVMRDAEIPPRAIVEILHGTTVASNAVLERKGALTGLITTRGFRDVLEIRTLRMPRLYDLSWEKPAPLVARELRIEVDERINAAGEVERPLVEAEVEAALKRLLHHGVEAVAVSFLHSYRNPAHEELVKRVAARLAPGLPLSLSSEVLPEIKEYERTSTTVINAYIRPIVERYLCRLESALGERGIAAPLLLMQSNGGLMTAKAAALVPIHIIESGPAAGVVGARALALASGISHAISFDMGGTTAKASLIENGEVTRAIEVSVGGGVMVGSRLLSGAGYTLKVPAIDLAEIGAGGGSILWIDTGGALQIGPRSAGASPGPVAYDRGGTEPTVTDANIALGYLDPHHLVGGALPLNAEKARRAIAERIAAPLRMSIEAAALGAYRIAAATMIRALRAVSSERGRDPRDYALVAFGGSGPLFAAAMAEVLGLRRILIPPSAGVFSSFGLLYSDVEYHFAKSHKALLRELDPAEFERILGGLESEARRRLLEDGFGPEKTLMRRCAYLHYQGQSFELEVPLASGAPDRAALALLEEAFGREHERTYGHRAGAEEPVELVTLKVIGRGICDRPRSAAAGMAAPPPAMRIAEPRREAYFGGEKGWLAARVMARAELREPLRGPAIVEEYDSTTLIPPGATARLDPLGNIAIEVSGGDA